MVIEVRNISRSYISGDVRLDALKDCSFSIEAGEFLAIMGPSGSGKSTLMNLLGLLDRPSSGSLYIQGKRTDTLSDTARAQIRNLTFGFVFQSYNLLSRHTAVENVELPMIYAGIGASERRTRALKSLGVVGLAKRQGHLPQQLSGGEQQRVAIARALANRPELILADEPTGALDTRRGQHILRIFQAINMTGRTIIVVTHDERVAQHAQRVLRLKDGEIVSDKLVKNRIVASDSRASLTDGGSVKKPAEDSESAGRTGQHKVWTGEQREGLVPR